MHAVIRLYNDGERGDCGGAREEIAAALEL